MRTGVPIYLTVFGVVCVFVGISLYGIGIEGYLPGNIVLAGGIAVTFGIGGYVLREKHAGHGGTKKR